jgi:oligoribonuclease
MEHISKLIWLDLEMTGLNPQLDRIVEIATIITDSQLNIIAKGPNLIIHQEQTILEHMSDWVKTHHKKSGLIEAIITSKITEQQAMEETLNFLKQHLDPNMSPMCGNSICQDRRFIATWMPELERFFHYRNLDVSSMKILFQLWHPHLPQFSKKLGHRALQDTEESIAELKYYRPQLGKLSNNL